MSSQKELMVDKFIAESLPKANTRDPDNGRKLPSLPQKNERIHLPICPRGSFTLEAAVIYPLVAAFWVSILFFFRVMQVETAVQEALCYSSRMTAAEASAVEGSTGLLLSAEGFFLKEIAGDSYVSSYVKGGSGGISLLKSEVSGDYISLRAEYTVKLPISFFTWSGISLVQNSSSRKWTGRDVEGETDDPYVYYTDYGSVYHLTENCSYLNLKIKSVGLSTIASLRNQSGAIYYACLLCGASSQKGGAVYYTPYGTCYHSSLTCSGLKRTIHMVRKSAVAGMRACSRCGGE